MARRTWFESRQSQKRFIKSQVRVGLGILTDLNWHLPSNITIMINAPSQLKGETRMVYYYRVFQPSSEKGQIFPHNKSLFTKAKVTHP